MDSLVLTTFPSTSLPAPFLPRVSFCDRKKLERIEKDFSSATEWGQGKRVSLTQKRPIFHYWRLIIWPLPKEKLPLPILWDDLHLFCGTFLWGRLRRHNKDIYGRKVSHWKKSFFSNGSEEREKSFETPFILMDPTQNWTSDWSKAVSCFCCGLLIN